MTDEVCGSSRPVADILISGEGPALPDFNPQQPQIVEINGITLKLSEKPLLLARELLATTEKAPALKSRLVRMLQLPEGKAPKGQGIDFGFRMTKRDLNESLREARTGVSVEECSYRDENGIGHWGVYIAPNNS